MTFRGYEKHGRRPVNMRPPHVLYEYMDKDGRTAFEYDTEEESIRFDFNDFYTAKNMFGMSIGNLADICKEYVADKFNEPLALKSNFFTRRLNQ